MSQEFLIHVMQQVLSTVIELAVTLIIVPAIGILAASAVKFVALKIKEYESHMTERQRLLVLGAVQLCAQAAEQMGLKDELLQDGAKKKAWALQRAQEIADYYKIKVNVSELEAMLEASLLAGIHQGLQEVDLSELEPPPHEPMGLAASVPAYAQGSQLPATGSEE
jgi:hypothetical protein